MKIDHIGLPARDPRVSATELAELLGSDPPIVDGPGHDLYRISVSDASVQFYPASAFTPAHVAFSVEGDRFDAMVSRLENSEIPFGNDPEDTRNGQVEDQTSDSERRIYWTDRNGHLFEACTATCERLRSLTFGEVGFDKRARR